MADAPEEVMLGAQLRRWDRLRICKNNQEDSSMGRGILLWLLGVPIPVIIILALLWH